MIVAMERNFWLEGAGALLVISFVVLAAAGLLWVLLEMWWRANKKRDHLQNIDYWLSQLAKDYKKVHHSKLEKYDEEHSEEG